MTINLAKILTVISLCLLLFSCAITGSVSRPADNHLIENVPFFPQEEYQCGPASLAGILNYFGIAVSPDEIAREIYSKSAHGTLTMDMVLFAQRKGMSVIQYKGNMDDLRKNIDSKNPLIVMIDMGSMFVQQNHFIVVTGYNEFGVIVNSGAEKGKFISSGKYLKTWEKTGFWTLLITGK